MEGGGVSEHALFVQQLLSPDGIAQVPSGSRVTKKRGKRPQKRSERENSMLKPLQLTASSTGVASSQEAERPLLDCQSTVPGSLRDKKQKPVLESCSQDMEKICLASTVSGLRCSKRRCKGHFCTVHAKLAASKASSDNLFDSVESPAQTQLQLAIRSSLEENEEALAEIRRSNDLIDRRLQRQGRQRLVVQGDGNCQFAAVLASAQLDMTVGQLRERVVAYLAPLGQKFREKLEERFQGKWSLYLQHISKDGSWGDPLTLLAMAPILRRPIVVITDSVGNAQYTSTVEPPDVVHPDTWGYSPMLVTLPPDGSLF